jgi:hypothetical protein
MNDVNDVNAIYTNSWTLQQAIESLALAANEIESLHARVEELERESIMWHKRADAYLSELAAMKQQEP